MERLGSEADAFAGGADACEVYGGGDVLFAWIGKNVGGESVIFVGAQRAVGAGRGPEGRVFVAVIESDE